MVRRCGSSKPTPTPLPCEATKPQVKMLKQKITNGERKSGSGLQKTSANGGIDRCESYHFPQINEGNGTKGNIKGRTGLSRVKNKCENAGVEGGIVENLASKTPRGRKSASERYVRSPTRARNGHRTAPFGDDVETERRTTGKIPP